MNQVPYQPMQPQTTVVQVQQPQIPAEYKPIGAWAFFGWQLLFNLRRDRSAHLPGHFAHRADHGGGDLGAHPVG